MIRSDLHGLMVVFFGKDGRKSLSLVRLCITAHCNSSPCHHKGHCE